MEGSGKAACSRDKVVELEAREGAAAGRRGLKRGSVDMDVIVALIAKVRGNP